MARSPYTAVVNSFDEELKRHVQAGNVPLTDQLLANSTSVSPFAKRNIIREAISSNQLAMVSHLVQRADFATDLLLWNSVTNQQYNILDYAIVLNQTAAALHIISQHLDHVRQVEPCRSITLAAEYDNRDVLRALLQISAHPYIGRSYRDQINMALITAAQRGFTGIVEEILAKNRVDLEVEHITRAVKIAATYGNVAILDLLAKTYNFDLSDDQWELLRAACLNGQAKVVEWLLLEVKVRVDHLYLVDTFLSVVKSEKQPTEVVRVLLDNTDISMVTDVYPRKLLLFLKKYLRHEMYGTLSAHLVSKGHNVRSILLGEAWAKLDMLTVLQSPDKYDHNELLYALIDAGDTSGVEQVLQHSSSLDLTAKDYKAMRKVIKLNDLEAAKLIGSHPTLKITRSRFCQVLSDCQQAVKSQTNSNMTPRVPILKYFVREVNIDVPKILANLEAKYNGLVGILNTLAK